MKQKIKIQKPASALNMTPEQRKRFKAPLNMAFLLAHLTDGFFNRAEQVLQEQGKLEIDMRTNWKHAVQKIRKVTLYTDATLDKDADCFQADLMFLDRLMLLMLEKATDEEKQEKILTMIRCMNL